MLGVPSALLGPRTVSQPEQWLHAHTGGAQLWGLQDPYHMVLV